MNMTIVRPKSVNSNGEHLDACHLKLLEIQQRVDDLPIEKAQKEVLSRLIFGAILTHLDEVDRLRPRREEERASETPRSSPDRFSRIKFLENVLKTRTFDTGELETSFLWMSEQGRAKDISLLMRFKDAGIWQHLSDANHDIDKLLSETERAIILRASEDAGQWLEALSVAGADEKLWLVTALVARLVLRKKDLGVAEKWGSAESSRDALVTPAQLVALVRLLGERSADLRAETAIALGEGGDESVVSGLRAALRREIVPPVRTHIFAAYGLIGGQEALAALEEAAAAETDVHAALHAVNSLRHLRLSTQDAQLLARIDTALHNCANARGMPILAREVARRAALATSQHAGD